MLNYTYLELRKNFPGWVEVGVVGLAENKANSAPIKLKLELRLSLSTFVGKQNIIKLGQR